ncbi:bifunctional glutamate N-acetyltransferase/amino-acid acetyltransferase ArgJ [Raineyella fluvialis]|uniref:Arginine biosynthesis bifunctional protein ArgJ n=1 Tax=Raineyella fluvialis TaxID=2662261 RepID=A0A5Q2FI70_9ACTN|nr:bifunctional glutamate N-acetyltransferase/amino-acid acetyltransferase ArgJ [Raineyella fluvialis]QGF24863.1 bifunctional glutamate N-acetyltransferase/amino-acid acetyltransferase ArgJ [Raineyella fluvialis]
MSVTAAQGFTAAGVAAGIKASGRKDLALVRNLGPRFDAAGVFTSNRICAAPVTWSRQAIADGRIDAVVLNSGGANACTGVEGFADTHHTAEKVGEELGIAAGDVVVCSTGLIGARLPMDALLTGITTAAADLSADGGLAAAEAIMTTDTRPKEAVRTVDGWTVGGMAKGAGMLAPGLATMLVVITTDAVVPAEDLQSALGAATRVTFDRLDSDGCMSTNDTVVALASGASGITPEATAFLAALTEVCHDLGQQLIGDAEGASHDIAVRVVNAASEDDAVQVARSITGSNLFKCAIFGNDPNWGRVLSALGTTAAAYEPDGVDVSFNGVMVCRGGAIGEPRELVDLHPRAVDVLVDLHAGDAQATVWTNDLTYDYVKENAEYSS